jgi:serine/threonine-protein kinase
VSGREPDLSGLSATLIEHMDEICDRFDGAWKDGLRPRIEEYLGEEGEPGRSVLLHELLAAEIQWRRRLGERPQREEYRERLAAHSSVVDAAFEGNGTATGSTVDHGARASASPAHPEATSERRFRILRRHAEGGLGVVYLAHDEELNREVALKEIRPEHADRAESRARFLLEAEINGRLEHPGIVPVYSLGAYEDGRPYCAMRLIEGATLKEAIDQFHGGSGRDPGERSMALRKLLDRFRAVCDALSYAHSRGVLHRDVKPHNIILGRYGETLLVDWGLAKAKGDAAAEASALRPLASAESGETVAGSTLGTPAYMSPEQADGRLDRLGTTTDVYGLGATLYHLLTGRPAFDGAVKEVLEKVRRGEFPAPRTVRRDIPPALEAVCLKAMALRPEGRYTTVGELADDLERWLADEPVSSYREPWLVRGRRWARRHRTLVIAATAAVLLTAAVLGVCVLMWCLPMI